MSETKLFQLVKKFLKQLRIPFVDPCDLTYTGDCLCGSSKSIVNLTRAGNSYTFTSTDVGNVIVISNTDAGSALDLLLPATPAVEDTLTLYFEEIGGGITLDPNGSNINQSAGAYPGPFVQFSTLELIFTVNGWRVLYD